MSPDYPGQIGIHCRASLGRSSLILAYLLAQNKMGVDEAFLQIAGSRGCAVPDTDEQRAWVQSHVKELQQF